MCTSKSRPRTCADNPRLVKVPPLARAGGPPRLRDTARSRLSLAPESLAEELSSAAANYGSIVWTLTSGPWTGPSSRSIAAAAQYMT